MIEEQKMLNTEAEIKAWLDLMGVENYTININTTNHEFSVNVNGDVNLAFEGLTYLPVCFDIVSGYFDCSNNKLTSLKGSPVVTGKDFDCSNNQITELNESKMIEGSLLCTKNPIQISYNIDIKVNNFEHECNQPEYRIEAFRDDYMEVGGFYILNLDSSEFNESMQQYKILKEKENLEKVVNISKIHKSLKL
jgi:hypothetical protein